MSTTAEEDVRLLMDVLRERWVLALATTTADGLPYATPLFYALASLPPADAPILVFASRADTCHGRAIGDGPTAVAGAVYLETETLGVLRGVQLRGDVAVCSSMRAGDHADLRRAYLERHPAAAAHLGPRDGLYALAITWAKLTDNRLGFGVRRTWTFASPWVNKPEHPVVEGRSA